MSFPHIVNPFGLYEAFRVATVNMMQHSIELLSWSIKCEGNIVALVVGMLTKYCRFPHALTLSKPMYYCETFYGMAHQTFELRS